MKYLHKLLKISLIVIFSIGIFALSQTLFSQTKKPNIIMLMTDDTGWNDFGAYSGGGVALGHPTPNVDRIAKEGAVFTSWYGQASCTAGRASFMTGRLPIRSALSIFIPPATYKYLSKKMQASWLQFIKQKKLLLSKQLFILA